MKQRLAVLLTGLAAGLINIPYAAAALPGQNVWQPIGETFAMIWPPYAGQVGHAIDAILLFMILTMTVVDIAKRTNKVPVKAAWAVGIGLWLSITVPLYTSGRLLFNNPWFAFLGFLITTIVFASLLKGVFERIFNNRAHIMQWVVSLCIAILAVGSLFAAVLENLDVRTPAEEFITSFMFALIALAAPILLIVATIAAINVYKSGTAKGRVNNTDKARKQIKKQLGNQRKEQQKIESARKQEDLLKGLETQREGLEKELFNLEESVGEDLVRIKQRADALLKNINEVTPRIKEYATYAQENRGRFKKTQATIENSVGEGYSNRNDLPSEYYAQLDAIAASYEKELDALVEDIKNLEHHVLEEQQKIHGIQTQDFDKRVDAYEKQLDDSLTQIDQVINDLEYIERVATRVQNKTEHADAGPLHQALHENNAYKQLANNLANKLSNALRHRESLREYQAQFSKHYDSLKQYFRYTQEHLENQEKALRRGIEAIQKLPGHANKARKEVVPGIRVLDAQRVAQGAAELAKLTKETTVELTKVDARREREEEIQTYFGRIDDVLDQTQRLYEETEQELITDLATDFQLASITEAAADLEQEIIEIDALIVQEAQTDLEPENRRNIRLGIAERAEQAPRKLRKHLAEMLNDIRTTAGREEADEFSRRFVQPVQTLSNQLRAEAQRISEAYNT